MTKKQLTRMWQYFIEATTQIIEREGIHQVTVRKVADIAGYQSSTIYNYFEELSHLVFFASLRFLKPYIDELPVYMAKGENSLEKYLLCWECFCRHSFKEPQIYNSIFLSNLGDSPEEMLRKYYLVYEQDIIDLPEDLKPMFLEHNLSKRTMNALHKAIEDGYIKQENVESVIEMTILIWKGMINSLLNYRANYNADEACEKTMKYIREITLKNAIFVDTKQL